MVSYVLPEAAEGDLTLTFRDASGAELRTFKSKKQDEEPKPAATSASTGGESAVAPGESAPAPSAAPPETAADKKDEDDEPKAPAKAGLNRFVWDMRGAPAQKNHQRRGPQGRGSLGAARAAGALPRRAQRWAGAR